MKNFGLVIILTQLYFFDVFAQKNLPNIPIQNLKGEQILTPEIFKNKPTIISFWATWCKPCIQEINAINDNWENWKGELDLDFIAISTDDTRSKGRVLSMKNTRKWQFEVFIDENGDLQRAMNVLNIPHTFILNAEGKIIYQHTSYATGDEEEYLEILKKNKK